MKQQRRTLQGTNGRGEQATSDEHHMQNSGPVLPSPGADAVTVLVAVADPKANVSRLSIAAFICRSLDFTHSVTVDVLSPAHIEQEDRAGEPTIVQRYRFTVLVPRNNVTPLINNLCRQLQAQGDWLAEITYDNNHLTARPTRSPQ